ncbi:efflux RND transporter periplasmic adaptor subunit [candidate division WOR-3 bacterium]|nr:efflux RND transporter periplasmic adaptor subunit [candidate division WOR-3 bacterium]
MKLKLRSADYVVAIFAAFILTSLCLLILGKIDETIHATGVVEPKIAMKVRSSVGGLVEKVMVDEGQKVSNEDTLVILDNRELELTAESLANESAQIEEHLQQLRSEFGMLVAMGSYETAVSVEDVGQAYKRAVNAKEKYDRMEILYQKDLVSIESRNDSKMNYELLQSQYESTKRRLELTIEEYLRMITAKEAEKRIIDETQELVKMQIRLTKVIAPISGVITTPDLHQLKGMKICEGDVILEIADISEVYFKAYVKEQDIIRSKVGQKAHIFVNAFPHRKYKVFEGRVSKIYHEPKLAEAGVVFEVQILIESPWVEVKTGDMSKRLYIRPGLTGKAEMVVKSDVRLYEEIFRRIHVKG